MLRPEVRQVLADHARARRAYLHDPNYHLMVNLTDRVLHLVEANCQVHGVPPEVVGMVTAGTAKAMLMTSPAEHQRRIAADATVPPARAQPETATARAW